MISSRATAPRAIENAPTSLAETYNNLGFAYLTRGRVEAALDAFQRASELGFERPDLLDANLACCHYMRGSPRAAEAIFDRCASGRSLLSVSVLHGLCGNRLFVVTLRSAGSYVQLMAANAAWSAHCAGRDDLAIRYLSMAEPIPGQVDDDLVASILGLKEELRAVAAI